MFPEHGCNRLSNFGHQVVTAISIAQHYCITKELKEELEAKTKAEAESRSNTPNARGDVVTPSQQTDDNSSMLNHFVLLGAVALLAYLAHTVVKHSQELGG